MTEIRIPKPGDAIVEGTIAEWRVEEGQGVRAGDVLYELETDKTSMEIESPAAGRIHLIGEAGGVYAVGDLIATIE